MPTTCAVVNCTKQHSTKKKTGFYRFPSAEKYPGLRRQWLAFVSRKNPDGSPWKPGTRDCVCSEHFISGWRSMVPLDPDYVPSVYPQKKLKTDDEDYDTGSSKGSSAVA